MKKTAFILIPVCLVAALFLLFASNRVIVPVSPTLPSLSAHGDLQQAGGSSNGSLKSVSFEKTQNHEQYTLKVTAIGLPFGTVIPASSAEVKTNAENDIKQMQKLLPSANQQISEAREFSLNGKPGCVYVLTSQKSNGESYAMILQYVENGALFSLSSNVKVGKLTAQNKAEADRLFEKYLAELQTKVK